MGFVGRLNFLGKLIMGAAIIGLLWFRIVNPFLMPKLESGGKYHGPMSSPLMNLESVAYAVIGLLLVGGFLWFVLSSARKERSRQPQRRRRP